MAEFQFTCPQCGESVEADETMRGMVASCPNCDTEIVIPRTVLKPGLTGNKTQGVARNTSCDPNFLAIQRKIEEDEETARNAAERIAQTRKMNLKREALTKSVYALIGVVICTAGLLWWKIWHDGRIAEAARQQAAIEAQQRIEAEERIKAEESRKAEAEKRKAEAETRRQEREAQRKAEAEERERRRAEDARRRAEEEKARKDRIAAKNAEIQLREDRRKQYNSVLRSLNNFPVELWRDLSEDRRSVIAKGDFYSLVPEPSGAMMLCHINDMSVSSLSKSGDVESVQRDAYEAAVSERGALITTDGKAYMVLPKTNGEGLFPVPQSSVNPSELSLRGVCDIIRKVYVNMDGISFVVSYVSADRKTIIPVKNMAFDCSVRRDDVIDAVTQHSLKAIRPKEPVGKAKRTQRTVVFYDGPRVKKSLAGITYVPKTPPARATKSQDRIYTSLCEEARRQEEEEKRQEQEERRQGELEAEQARELLTAKIEETLDSGRIKISVSSR